MYDNIENSMEVDDMIDLSRKIDKPSAIMDNTNRTVKELESLNRVANKLLEALIRIYDLKSEETNRLSSQTETKVVEDVEYDKIKKRYEYMRKHNIH